MASPTPPLDVDLAACRPRRFSLLPLPTSSAPRPPRRSSQRTQSLSLPATRDNSALPSTVPLAFPPYMPMLKPPTPGSPARLVKAPSSPSTTSRRPASGLEEDLWNEPPSTPPRRMHVPASSPAKTPSHTPTRDGSSSRLRRRLQRWTRSRDLDFGCAGDWSEGPADMGDSFYSRHPGGSSRTSTASSSDELASWTHSRGQSTSSDWSVSTAASSIPTSPVLNCSMELLPPAPLSPSPSRVPLTPRTAHRRRKSDEAAAVDAANQYFHRVRLSQIAEDDGSRKSRCSSTGRSSASTTPPPLPTRDSSPAGLAIYGAGSKPLTSLDRSRSVSRDLEIEFIETGHTTYTPLSVHFDDFPSSAIILTEDAFLGPAPSPTLVGTPSARSTFTAESADSCETAATGPTPRSAPNRRSPIAAGDIGPALDELSEYFSSSVPELSCGSSMTSSSSASTCGDAQAGRLLPLTSLAPPSPISPQRKHTVRYSTTSPMASPPPSPLVGKRMPFSRHRRQSSSFAAAERAKLAAAGFICPLEKPQVVYDWI